MKKKIIMAIVCLMTMTTMFVSCGTVVYDVTANYEVCYPDGTRSFGETMQVVCSDSKSVPVVASYSSAGTNYIHVKSGPNFISTTAPVRLNSYAVEKLTRSKKEKSNNRVLVTVNH